ncbi:response regulator [bacterium]|nr:response regulator [candidate division CSSED10-310 bacterium]
MVSSPGNRSPIICIVEDNRDNRDLLLKLLTHHGFAPLVAENARDFMKLLAGPLPDLILLDLRLPDCNGLTLVRNIKADPRLRSIPVVALTAFAMPEDREQALNAGCDHYLSKPIDIQELLDTISTVLSRP